MKALTVRQPRAGLIAAGIKDVESRTWTPPERLAIHAGVNIDTMGHWAAAAAHLTSSKDAVLCVVRLHAVVNDSRSKWAKQGWWHWVLDEVRLVEPPVPAVGRLGLWDRESA